MAFSDLLAVTTIQRVMDELVDITTLPQPLVWSGRIPSIPALDGEIMARYSGQVFAADLVMDDAKAVIRSYNPLRLTQTAIPNLKHGFHINQGMISTLARIEANLAGKRDVSIFEDYVGRIVLEARLGVAARQEALLVAMLTDSFSYNSMGVVISNGSWGMPADLKVTPSTLWSDAANATPINDILNVRQLAIRKYGITYNRITMAQTTFYTMCGTAEFIARARLYSQLVNLNAAANLASDTATLKVLAARVLDGMEIEFYDNQVWTEGNDASKNATRYLPSNKVVLTTTVADNVPQYWDWANGEVMETMPGMVPLLIGAFDGPREGPVAYATAADPHGNPPGKIIWGVGRGYPRKHRESINACLTVL